MKALLLSSLTAAIAVTLLPAPNRAIALPSSTPEFEQSELISHSYTYRRFRGGTGRREILS
jgi:hypothetical protein